MKKILDSFLEQINQTFSEFTLTSSCIDEGLLLISQSNKTKNISLKLDKEIYTEPISYQELLNNSESIKINTTYNYQNIIIAKWLDVINEIFVFFLKKHFVGDRIFSELKKQKVNIDFSSSSSLEIQAMDSLKKDFSFKNYTDKFKLINDLLLPNKLHSTEIGLIKKHVLIRNAIQHHNSKAYKDMFLQLGVNDISLLNTDGEAEKIIENDIIRISIPELDKLKRGIIYLTQKWREDNG